MTPSCPRCPISCTRIVGAKRRRALAGQTPVGMLDRAAILLAPHPSFIVCVRPHSRGRLAVIGRQAFKAGADGAVFVIWGFCAQTARAGLESTTAFGDAPSGTAHLTRVVVLPRLFPVCLGAYGSPPVAFVCPSSPWPLVERCPKVSAWTKRPAEYGNNPKMLVSGTHPQWHKPASRQAVGDVMRGLADHHSWRCTNVMVTTRLHQCPLSRERCCKYFPTSVEAKPSPTFNTKLQPPNHSWRQFWTFAPSIVYAIHSPHFAVIADLNFEDRSGRRLPTP